MRVLRFAEENSYSLSAFSRPGISLTQELLTLGFPTLATLIDRPSGDGAEDLWGNESNV
jgi:hypothetical protein